MVTTRHTRLIVPLAIIALFLLSGFCLYGSFSQDDAYITFWASYTLSHFGDILNYNGERVEQSSTLLLTLLIALVSHLTALSESTSGFLLSNLAGAIGLWLTYVLNTRVSTRGHIGAMLLLVFSPALLAWTTSRMEGPLAVLCILWFVIAWGDLLSHPSIRAWSLISASLATMALVLVRPEMVILVCIVAIGCSFLLRRQSAAAPLHLIIFTSICIGSVILLLLWRQYYFHALFPLPVYAKTDAPTFNKLFDSFKYLLDSVFHNPIYIVALFGVYSFCFSRESDPQTLIYRRLIGCILLTNTAFVLSSGGDWMSMGRFLLPALPLAAIIVINQLLSLSQFQKTISLVALLAVDLYGTVDELQRQSTGVPIWASYHISPAHQQQYSVIEQYNQVHLRDMEIIDAINQTIDKLRTVTSHKPITLLSGTAGMVYYYTAKYQVEHYGFGSVYFYDVRGLTETTIYTCQRDKYGSSVYGLAVSVDAYLLQQASQQNNAECKPPRIDLVFQVNDLSRQMPQRIADAGFTMIRQDGGMVMQSDFIFQTHGMYATDFLMVSNTLLPALGNPSYELMNYNKLPLVSR